MATSNKKAPVRKSNTRYASSSKSSRPKSRTGSSSLARSSKSTIFTKRNGIIAAGMAAVAGLAFVAFSFASGAPKTPDYQYSFSKACIPTGTTTGSAGTPAPTDAEQLKAQQDCYDKSAEGLVYRVYKGVFNREPNAGEYAYWVQQLAGDRVQGTTFVGKMIASNGAVVPKTATDAEFITGLYKNMLLRTDDKITVDKKGTDYWAKKMQGAKKWSRIRVAYHFATTSESKRANAGTFVTYISNATPVVIKENAKEAQAARLVQMKKYATTAGTNATAAKRAENAAKSALGTAKASSSLEAIAANKATAAAEAAKARTAMRAAKTAAGKADRLKKRARSLAVYAKDIGADPVYGMAKINDVHKLTKAYSTNASKSASTAGKTLAQIDAAYAARRAKIAEEAAAAAAASAASTSRADLPNGTGKVPPPPAGATQEEITTYMTAACKNTPPGSKKSWVKNGYAYQKINYYYPGSGTACASRNGAYVGDAICNRFYTPVKWGMPGFGCKLSVSSIAGALPTNNPSRGQCSRSGGTWDGSKCVYSVGYCKVSGGYVQYIWVQGTGNKKTLTSWSKTSSKSGAKSNVDRFSCRLVSGTVVK